MEYYLGKSKVIFSKFLNLIFNKLNKEIKTNQVIKNKIGYNE